MKPEERANIMKTLKELTEKIAQLQNEMNPNPASQVPSAKPNHSGSKTKTDVSLGHFGQVCFLPFVSYILLLCKPVIPHEQK